MGGTLTRLLGAEEQSSVQRLEAKMQQQLDALKVEMTKMQSQIDALTSERTKPRSTPTERLFAPNRDTCDKVAVLVYPDYEAKPWELGVDEQLEELHKLCRTFDFRVFELAKRRVTANDVKMQLQDAVALEPKVIMFVFGGHGKPNTSASGERVGKQHGTLCLTAGTLSEDDIAKALGAYCGTFIELLIMCSAGASQPVAHNANAGFGEGDARGWGKQGQIYLPTPDYKAIQFFASVPNQTIRRGHALKVLEAFVNAKGKTYADLRAKWPEQWTRGEDAAAADPPDCIMACNYSGAFPNEAVISQPSGASLAAGVALEIVQPRAQ